MEIGENIKRLREDKGLTQQQIAELVNMHRSNYSKVESGQRELSVKALTKIAKYFGVTLDQLVNGKGSFPEEIKIEDTNTLEQVKLIQELNEEDRNMVFKMIETFVTKKKFKEFFSKNVAAL